MSHSSDRKPTTMMPPNVMNHLLTAEANVRQAQVELMNATQADPSISAISEPLIDKLGNIAEALRPCESDAKSTAKPPRTASNSETPNSGTTTASPPATAASRKPRSSSHSMVRKSGG